MLRALGSIVAAAALLGAMLWIIGNPNLVLLWRAEYLIGAFVALLLAAALLAAWRRRKAPAAERGSAAAPWVRGIGIALGAVLLMLALYAFVS